MAKCEYFQGKFCDPANIEGCMLYKQFINEVQRPIQEGQKIDFSEMGERTNTLAGNYKCPYKGKLGDVILETIEKNK